MGEGPGWLGGRWPRFNPRKEGNPLCLLPLILDSTLPLSVPPWRQLKWFPAPLGHLWEQQELPQHKIQAQAGS